MRISDWSSDVCSSDLSEPARRCADHEDQRQFQSRESCHLTLAGDQRAAVAVREFRRADGEQAHGFVPEDGSGRLAEIGRASWRESACQYVLISVVAVSFKKHTYHY